MERNNGKIDDVAELVFGKQVTQEVNFVLTRQSINKFPMFLHKDEWLSLVEHCITYR